MDFEIMKRHPLLKDFLGLVGFVLCVIAGTMLINSFIFRSFNVEGASMEPTMYTGDRLIVNRIPVTMSQLQNKQYIPERGQIIVFKNPQFHLGSGDEFIVKRVIAFPGERVTVVDGKYTVYNDAHPRGFNPDDANNGEPGSPTSGDGKVDTIVADGTLFVSGDHRQDNYSYDSRNGLGLVPFYDVVGPVSARIFPFNKIRFF